MVHDQSSELSKTRYLENSGIKNCTFHEHIMEDIKLTALEHQGYMDKC